MPKISEACAVCGKIVERYVKPSRVATHRRVFCNRVCHAQFFSGDGNPMKNPETKIKASKSASKKFEDPKERSRCRQAALKNWAAGRYDGVRVGQCEWHELQLRDGRTIKLQGTWELKYARWMDERGIPFEAHRGRLPYIDDDGIVRSYYPDFRLSDGTFVDVKNPLYLVKHARKLALVQEQNGVCVQIICQRDLEDLGLL